MSTLPQVLDFAQTFRSLRSRWPAADINTVIDAAAALVEDAKPLEARLGDAIAQAEQTIAANTALLKEIDYQWQMCQDVDAAQSNMGRGPY